MKYLITLKPLIPFFFGGENTFGEGGNHQNYFIHSQDMPQVSTIIGMLRYVLLKKDGKLIQKGEDFNLNKKDRDDLIGTKAFSIKDAPAIYGKIKSISPVFVKTGEKYLMPCPVDYGYDVTLSDSLCYCVNNGTNKPLPVVVGKETKKVFPYKDYNNWNYWIDNTGARIVTSQVFGETEQIGIKKGQTDKKSQGFFKQTLKYFVHSESVFAFTADIDYELGNEQEFVQMGGNRSTFLFKAEKIDNQEMILSLFQKTSEFVSVGNRLVLMSDAYLDQEVLDNIDFLWGTSVDNRYNEINQKGGWSRTNVLYHLIKRGSVIFCKNLDKVKESLDNQNLQNVGLNRYIENINK